MQKPLGLLVLPVGFATLLSRPPLSHHAVILHSPAVPFPPYVGPPNFFLYLDHAECPTPEEVALEIAAHVKKTRSLPARHLMKLLPVSLTCFASAEELKGVTAKMVERDFGTGGPAGEGGREGGERGTNGGAGEGGTAREDRRGQARQGSRVQTICTSLDMCPALGLMRLAAFQVVSREGAQCCVEPSWLTRLLLRLCVCCCSWPPIHMQTVTSPRHQLTLRSSLNTAPRTS